MDGPSPAKRAKLEIARKLMDCDDLVLLEILRKLQINDLITMADVNKRFKMLSEHIFSSRHRNFVMSSVGRPWKLTKLSMVLYHFAEYLNQLIVDADDLDNPSKYPKMMKLLVKQIRSKPTEVIVLNTKMDTFANRLATNEFRIHEITQPMRMLQIHRQL